MNIKDLTNTAQVTRGTFYLHYKDKDTFVDNVMFGIINDFFKEIVVYHQLDNDEEKQTPSIVLDKMYRFIGNYPDFFITLLKENDARKYQELLGVKLYELIKEHVQYSETTTIEKVPKELVTGYLVFSILGTASIWIEEGMIYAEHFMATKALKAYRSQLFQEMDLLNFFETEADVPYYQER
ncbi:TetR/AcrR family transcriptional regulator [Vagococcus acidifermentans]|nr:TetR/AcrR family transcriptional regulator [Vagococcus acidifermentans]